MNIYVLTQQRAEGKITVAKVQASTQGQAARRLYRANRIKPEQARQLGFSVDYHAPAPTKEQLRG